jgi:hypothetical protein
MLPHMQLACLHSMCQASSCCGLVDQPTVVADGAQPKGHLGSRLRVTWLQAGAWGCDTASERCVKFTGNAANTLVQ